MEHSTTQLNHEGSKRCVESNLTPLAQHILLQTAGFWTSQSLGSSGYTPESERQESQWRFAAYYVLFMFRFQLFVFSGVVKIVDPAKGGAFTTARFHRSLIIKFYSELPSSKLTSAGNPPFSLLKCICKPYFHSYRLPCGMMSPMIHSSSSERSKRPFDLRLFN